MTVFAYSDFREFIVSKIEENADVKGYKSRLSEAAGVQRSFLTQVVNYHVLLTPDHALKLCQFWDFTEEETEYFLNLTHLSRAQTKETRDFYQKKINAYKKKYQDLKERLKPEKELSLTERNVKYYSSWVYGAVHMATSIPRLNTVERISKYLSLPKVKVEKVLQELRQMDLVDVQNKIKVSHLHLNKDSALTISNHSNWRQKVLQEFHVGQLEGLHYSLVTAISKKDVARLREMILTFFEEIKGVIGPSPEEEICVFLCDFFGPSEKESLH